MQDERCGQCGLPRWKCHNEDPDIEIKLEKDVCFVKKKIDIKEHEEQVKEAERTKKNQNKVPPNAGTVIVPRITSLSGRTLDVDVRDAYWVVEGEKAEARAKVGA